MLLLHKDKPHMSYLLEVCHINNLKREAEQILLFYKYHLCKFNGVPVTLEYI
jgi:hypothetical protein